MNDPRPALFRRYPFLEERIPYVRLGRWPTPVERVHLQMQDGVHEILIKREDTCARPYGGNKIRKLEFILAEAQRRGARRLITAGAAGSHHALATALYGKRLGFDVTLVLFPQSLTQHVREILLRDHALGAELRFTSRMEGVPLGVARARIAHLKEKTFVIAPGGSDAIGTLGYVSAAFELVEQIDAGQLPVPAAVHVAAGTLGTSAGLALGFTLADRRIPIIATRITGRIVTNESALRRLIRGAAARLRDAGVEIPELDAAYAMVQIRHGQLGRGYGKETDAGREAAEVFAEHGLRLDPTYTAKAAAELRTASVDPAHPPLFLLTLGVLADMEEILAQPDTMPREFRRYLGF